MYSLKNYLENEKSLSLNEFDTIYQSICNEVKNDEEANEFFKELVKKSIEYAKIRSEWLLMTTEQKIDADPGRTMKHDALIVKFNQLARYLKSIGKEASWRDELGYEEDDKMNRKRIGDMGCYIAFIYAINAR